MRMVRGGGIVIQNPFLPKQACLERQPGSGWKTPCELKLDWLAQKRRIRFQIHMRTRKKLCSSCLACVAQDAARPHVGIQSHPAPRPKNRRRRESRAGLVNHHRKSNGGGQVPIEHPIAAPPLGDGTPFAPQTAGSSPRAVQLSPMSSGFRHRMQT